MREHITAKDADLSRRGCPTCEWKVRVIIAVMKGCRNEGLSLGVAETTQRCGA